MCSTLASWYGAPMTSDLVTNVVSVYLSASEDEVNEGMDWYPSVNRTLIQKGIDPWIGGGIFAAYSINTPWYRNWDMAMGTLLTDMPRTDTLSISIRFACDILLGNHPMDVYAKSAPKLSAFTAAIADPDASTVAVIDRHARNIAFGQPLKRRVNRKDFRLANEAYCEAAELSGIPVHAMQAITWVSWRNRLGKGWYG